MHGLFVVGVILSWIIALAWVMRVVTALRQLPRIPDLLKRTLEETWRPGNGVVRVTVIVPARNEAAAIEATLRSLLAQTIPLEIFAVDDRSTDETGAIMERLAAESPSAGKYLSVIHVDSLPPGWMGKNHAMALAARQSATEWLLFTDGDTLFREDTLERALAYARELSVDHVVLWPSLILKTAGERLVESIFQSLLILTWNPWKISDPKAKRESIGMGAFNLVRSEVYRAVGGFEAEPMEVVEDIRLGSAIKRAGYRQHLLLGRDLLRLHWAPGAIGLLHNLTKNIFAMFRFRTYQLLIATFAIGLICFGPLAALFAPLPMRIAGIVSLVMICAAYWLSSRWFNRIPVWYCLTFPVGATLVLTRCCDPGWLRRRAAVSCGEGRSILFATSAETPVPCAES